MQLEKIITLANKHVELRFRVLERSLRASGCELPLLVIPYDDQKFDLPDNAQWWEVPELTAFLNQNQAHPMMRKYQCLTTANYQFVDTDIVVLRNPQDVLCSYDGFVACCGHWRNPDHAVTDKLVEFLSSKNSNWQRNVFNAGQFACDRALYSIKQLIDFASQPEYRETILDFPYHDQPGLNFLVAASEAPYVNITLPPASFESSWAGDYLSIDKLSWDDLEKRPYLIHWAGTPMIGDIAVNQEIFKYLSTEEAAEWNLIEAKRLQESLEKKSYKSRIKRKLASLIDSICGGINA